MNLSRSELELPLSELLGDFCGNPTPFKLIGTLDESEPIEEAIKLFESSSSKRKVLGIRTSADKVVHIGENELRHILKRHFHIS